MSRVKELTPRGTHLTIEKSIEQINRWYVGWSSYYKMTQYPSQLHKIEAHVRRRLRCRLISQQKSRRNLFNKLVKRHVPRKVASRTAYSNRGKWALSITRASHLGFPNKWFTCELRQKIRSEDKLSHWFEVEDWIRIS